MCACHGMWKSEKAIFSFVMEGDSEESSEGWKEGSGW